MTLSNKNHSLIEKIETPTALRELSESQLPQLADEIRAFIIDSVSKTGGHLASSLGTVELTVALHYVFNTPDDRLIWDVGHQTYAHKILTNRRDKMATLRQLNGLSGFTKRSESEFDAFGTGHSSTSISAALGMAIANSLTNNDRKSVAIIGDGAITAGMAYEALSHAGDVNCDMLVILNDNEMSISPNVGGMSKYLAKLLSGKFYSTVRESGKKVLSSMPGVQEFARRAEEHVKGMIIPGTLFEELGFNYIGPIDGHDIPLLISTLRNLKQHKGPQFLHIVTKKGRGYKPAEINPCTYHGVPPFNTDTGKLEKPASTGPTYTQVFGEWLCDMAKLDDKMVAITPAMREGSGMVTFSQRYPKRFFDVSIAEQHAVTLAAGMACEGLRPVVAIYSTFLQRGYDQLIHDVALQNLPVMFAIDRAGIVGADGATHAGAYDISFLRCIPNMVIMAPSDGNECRQMLYTGIKHNGPSAVRYPRGTATNTGTPATSEMSTLPIGKAEIRRKGNRVAILAFGSTLHDALVAAEKLDATVINMRFIKPLDIRLINQLAQTHELLVTIEDNTIQGGAGSAVGETLSELGLCPSLLHLGIPDLVTEHGPRDTLLHNYGLDGQGIIAAIRAHSGQITCQKHALELNSY